MLVPGNWLQGRYQIIRHLGGGGFAAVYLAEDTRLGRRPVAIKEFDPANLPPADRPWATAAFDQEAVVLARLNHPGIAQVSDFFQSGGLFYLIMEYVQGETLEAAWLRAADQRFGEQQVRTWAAQLCNVLDYLHSQQPAVIFRDLKPANIMVQPDGTLKLIDFGIARYFVPGKTRDTTALGTPGYAAPEQFGQGQCDPRTDIYALGATLHQLLTGYEPAQTPFQLPPLSQLAPQVSASLCAAVQRALEMDRQRRFATAGDFCRAMQPSAAPAGRFWVYAGVALLVLLLAAGGLFALNNSQDTPTLVSPIGTLSASEPTPTVAPAATAPPVEETITTITPIPEESTVLIDTPPDLTATYLAGCAFDATLVDAYTFQNPELDSALAGETFPMNWVLQNSGSCPWPADLRWAYQAGEPFNQSGPLPVADVVDVGQKTTLTTAFIAPGLPDTYEASWQLIQTDGTPFAAPISFAIRVYLSATPTPTPTPLVQVVELARSNQGQAIDLIQVGNGPRRFVFIGGLHGNEPRTAELVVDLANYFLTNQAQVMVNSSLYFVPSFNPDALAINSRYKLGGIDLNRNWDTPSWVRDSPEPGGILAGSGGAFPFSEPETAALRDLLLSLQADPNTESVQVIVYHHHTGIPNAGTVQPGYETYYSPVDNARALALTLTAEAGYAYLPFWDGSYIPTGELIQWCAIQGIAAVDVELPPTQGQGPDTIPPGQSRTILQAAIDSILALMNTP
jgi:serine/threonine protein kinase/predicted deacylase